MKEIKLDNGNILGFDTTGTGENVIFVHGYISDSRIWDDIKTNYSMSKVHGIFPTLEGFYSEKYDYSENDFNTDNHLQDIVQLIQKYCDGKPTHLVGWSYGASLVLMLAAERPDLVKSVFAYEPGISSFIEDKKTLKKIWDDRTDMAYEAIKALEKQSYDEAIKGVVDGACDTTGMFDSFDNTHRKLFLNNAYTVPFMFDKKKAPDLDISSAEMRDIKCKVTISMGENARLAYSLVAKKAVEAIPQSKLQIIPNAYHVVPVQDAKLFQKCVMEHINS